MLRGDVERGLGPQDEGAEAEAARGPPVPDEAEREEGEDAAGQHRVRRAERPPQASDAAERGERRPRRAAPLEEGPPQARDPPFVVEDGHARELRYLFIWPRTEQSVFIFILRRGP